VVWACNNLRQRWRHALNQAIPALVLAGDNPTPLPPVVPMTGVTLDARGGLYVAGRDTLDLRAGPGYLYASANRLGIPTDVMFFPQDDDHFSGFDPAGQDLTRLEFSGPRGRSLTFVLPPGRRVSAQRSAGTLTAWRLPYGFALIGSL
jgi:hypothetical protein